MDSYRTVSNETGNVIYKEKGSKFIGYVVPIDEEPEVKPYLDRLKAEHHAARHWCYAWQLGHDVKRYRANDDGEPNNSAGLPIYGQIVAHDLTNILVVVVRYFGGTKLGVGGLKSAYKTTAQMVLEEAAFVTKIITKRFQLRFEYAHLNKVMRIIKKYDLEICSRKEELDCEYHLAVRKKYAEKIHKEFTDLRCLTISPLSQ